MLGQLATANNPHIVSTNVSSPFATQARYPVADSRYIGGVQCSLRSHEYRDPRHQVPNFDGIFNDCCEYNSCSDTL